MSEREWWQNGWCEAFVERVATRKDQTMTDDNEQRASDEELWAMVRRFMDGDMAGMHAELRALYNRGKADALAGIAAILEPLRALDKAATESGDLWGGAAGELHIATRRALRELLALLPASEATGGVVGSAKP